MPTPDTAEILTRKMFVLHFSSEDCAAVTCRDCIDYKIRQCQGRGYAGQECLACMERHLADSHGMVLH